VHRGADAVPAEAGRDPVARAAADGADRRGDVADPAARKGRRNPRVQRALRVGGQHAGGRADRTDLHGDGGVAVKSVDVAPQSTESGSPALSGRRPGMPCTISSLTDRHSTPGYGTGAQRGW
jgi:hypothetical protein